MAAGPGRGRRMLRAVEGARGARPDPPGGFLHPRYFAITSPGYAGFSCPGSCWRWEGGRGAGPACPEPAPAQGQKEKFPGPRVAGPLPGRLRGSAARTPRLLVRIVGLKIEALAAAQLCSKGGERRDVGSGLSPPPRCPTRLGTSSKAEVGAPASPAEGPPGEEWGAMLARGAAAGVGGGALSVLPPRLPPSARLRRSWLRHLFSSGTEARPPALP